MKVCLRFSRQALFLAVEQTNMYSGQGNIWRYSNYFNELQKEDQAKYKLKLILTNGQFLFGIVENFFYLFLFFLCFNYYFLFIYYLFILYFNSVENPKKMHRKKMYWPIYTE